MASPSTSQQVQTLQTRVAQLERENARLHSELAHLQAQYERSQASLSQVAQLERAYAVLKEEGERELEIAREQEKAAQERAAELAKANEALGRSLNRLANERNLNSFLGHVLQEALQMLDGAIAQFFIYDPEFNTLMPSVAVDLQGEVLSAPGLMNNLPISKPFPATITKAWERMLNQRSPIYFDLVRDAEHFWPGTLDWHRSMGHCGSVCTALMMGDRPLGMLGLALRGRTEFTASEFEFFQALGQQATLAIQMTQLAEEAKLAALAKLNEVIAREQEKAAQERAAELARANATLRRSLSWLAHEGNLNQFLDRVLLEIASTAQADLAYLFVLQEPERMLEVTARVINGAISDHPTPTEPAIFLAPFSADITPAFRYMEEQNLFLTLDMAMLEPELTQMMWPDAINWHLREGRKQVASLVLKAGERSVGFLGLGFREAREFSQEEREFVHALANQASLAILLIQLAEEAKQAAIAREQEKAAQERAAELAKANEALQESLSKLADEPELEKFLGHVLTVCAERLGALGAGIWQMEKDEGYLIASYEDGKVNLPPESSHPGTIRAITQQNHKQNSKNDAVRLSKREMLAAYEEDFQSNPDYQPYLEYLQQRGIKAILSSPMFLGDSLRGSLTLRFDHRRVLKMEEAELAHALANQAMLALELTRLAEEAKQAAIAREQEKAAQERVAELMKANEALGRSLTMLANEPTLDKFLGYVVKAIAQQFNAHSAALWLHDWENMLSHLQFVYEQDNIIPAAQSNHPNAHRPSSMRDDVVAGQVLYRQNKPYLFNVKTGQGITEEQRQYLLNNGTHYLLTVPMLLGHQRVGNFTLRLGEALTFDSTKLELAQSLAHQATLALELTRLAEEAKQEAEQSAILTERNRIAREIHDTLAQCLTGIIVQLQAAEYAQTTNPGEELIHIIQAIELAKSGLVEARRSVRALRPQALEDATTLEAALTQLAVRHSHNLSATCQVIGTPYFLPSQIEANLLRIAQEALTNCLRHGESSQVAIALNYQPEQVTLQIQDDGCGFDTNQPTTEGYGLMGMRERAAEIGATLTLTSQPGAGTEVAIILPLSPEE